MNEIIPSHLPRAYKSVPAQVSPRLVDMMHMKRRDLPQDSKAFFNCLVRFQILMWKSEQTNVFSLIKSVLAKAPSHIFHMGDQMMELPPPSAPPLQHSLKQDNAISNSHDHSLLNPLSHTPSSLSLERDGEILSSSYFHITALEKRREERREGASMSATSSSRSQSTSIPFPSILSLIQPSSLYHYRTNKMHNSIPHVFILPFFPIF